MLALEFNDNSVAGAQHYTALGVRAGWLACAQLPLLILLIGKNNLIGMVTGVGYERLNVLHRWVARVMLLMATLHFGYQAFGWNQYGLLQLEWNTDTCPPTGIAAYAILLWLNLSTLAPFRHMAYEFFVVQHIVSFFGFIIALAIHLPATYARVYLYIPSALYLVDRLVRAARLAYNNRRLARASLEAKEGGVHQDPRSTPPNQIMACWLTRSALLASAWIWTEPSRNYCFDSNITRRRPGVHSQVEKGLYEVSY